MLEFNKEYQREKEEDFIVLQEMVKDGEELKKSLKIFTSYSRFEDDIWRMDKSHREQSVSKGTSSIYFSNIPSKYKHDVKIFVLKRLASDVRVRTINTNLYGVKLFLKYILKEMNDLPLKKVNKKVIFSFKEYLDSRKFAQRTKEAIWTGFTQFIKELDKYEQLKKINIKKNPYSISLHRRPLGNKYIDEYVTKQLDEIFKKAELPLVFRTAYWICRLIPNRITEVSSMKIGCIKPYINNEKIINIPGFKQNGGYVEPIIRQISIIDEGKGKFLLDLIREQEEKAKSIQSYMDDENKNFLFTYFPSQFIPTQNIYKELTGNVNKIAVLNEGTFNRMLRTFCKRYNVTNENGELYHLSSHMFRHNAITDRLYEGFRLVDIMSMTDHQSTQMIAKSYVHVDNGKLRAISEKVLKEDKSQVLFNGRIINTDDEEKAKRILLRPFAHRIGRLGICSDISNCPSKMYECLACENFIPNASEMEYFEEQVTQWKEKIKKTKNHPFMNENALYNFKLNENIVKKIKEVVGGEKN